MPRAIWRGAISFGMVAIPVRLYTATEDKDVSFRQLAQEDLKPVRYLRWSPTLDREVEYGELTRGYEYAKEQFVVVVDEDLETLPVPSKQVIAITQFVDGAEIDPIYYDKAYYLDPDEAGRKPYALLYGAMQEKGLLAIGKVALRQKERMVAIRPQDGHLTAELLLYPDEVRPYEGTDVSGIDVSKPEMDMAFALIDMLHQPFDPEDYVDEYREALMALITAKLEGGEIVEAEPAAEVKATVDLMAALRASVESARSRGGAPAPSAEQDADTGEEDEEEAPAPKRRQRAATSTTTAEKPTKKTSSAKSTAKSASSKPTVKKGARKSGAR